MSTNNTFTSFDQENDIITDVPSRVTFGLFSGNIGTMTTFFTSSLQTATIDSVGKFYHDVYASVITSSAQIEFSIAYGHNEGSGSLAADLEYPSKAIYSQYRNLLLDDQSSKFTLSDNTQLNDIVAITFNRSNLKQKLDAGNWQLNVLGLNGKTLNLIDDSKDSQDTNVTSIGRVLNVVSGTILGGTVGSASYGLCYPDYGIIVLAPGKINSFATFTYNTGSDTYKDNAGKFFDRIKSAGLFQARSEEVISSTHYFVRVKNKDYNYSTNPTFYTASDGSVLHVDFITDPKTFITSVGLYNNDNELLAVAKLSQPVPKSFSSECSIKIRLDF